MITITLRPKDEKDVPLSELESFATELRTALPDVDVRVASDGDEHRVGVTFVEIITVVIEGLGGLASLATITTATKSWLKRRTKAKTDHRPRVVKIYGPDGTVVREVHLDDDADDARIIDHDKR